MTVSLSAIQENLCTLLVFNDAHCKTIRNLVPPEWWGGPFALIARRTYEFIDRYKAAPKEHIADLLADKLEDKKNSRESGLYEDILLSIRDQHEGINTEYVMGQLENFIKRQSLRSIAIDVSRALQKDTDESLDEAERLIRGATQQQASVFDLGLRLGDADRVLDFLDQQTACFPTGIPELDKRGFGPTRKELWLYIAAVKKGKTWALIQLAKMAMVHRLKVCHISLEMSEERSAQRYLQAMFAMAKRKGTSKLTKFERDSKGVMTGLDTDKTLVPSLTMDDPNIRVKLAKRIKKFGPRMLNNVIIKQFPTGTLTVRQLEAYLDGLESNERFTPDLLIIDYPDLMKVDKANYRLSIDEIYKEIRGLAVGRNIAVAIVSQSHRAAAKSKHVGSDNVAEAYSKVAHADCIITYNQTKDEHALRLARLIVTGGRNDEDNIEVCISQNYATGAFVIDSTLMSKTSYWQNIPKDSNEET